MNVSWNELIDRSRATRLLTDDGTPWATTFPEGRLRDLVPCLNRTATLSLMRATADCDRQQVMTNLLQKAMHLCARTALTDQQRLDWESVCDRIPRIHRRLLYIQALNGEEEVRGDYTTRAEV